MRKLTVLLLLGLIVGCGTKADSIEVAEARSFIEEILELEEVLLNPWQSISDLDQLSDTIELVKARESEWKTNFEERRLLSEYQEIRERITKASDQMNSADADFYEVLGATEEQRLAMRRTINKSVLDVANTNEEIMSLKRLSDKQVVDSIIDAAEAIQIQVRLQETYIEMLDDQQQDIFVASRNVLSKDMLVSLVSYEGETLTVYKLVLQQYEILRQMEEAHLNWID